MPGILYTAQRSLPDSSLGTSKLDEGDQNDWKQMNDEEDLDQYKREDLDDAEDAKLANLPGEGEQSVTLVKSRDN